MAIYVDNKKFTNELGGWAKIQRERKLNGEKRESIPDYIAESVVAICTNLAFKPNFINYTYREDMIGDAIENCIRYITNFDSTRSNNAFAYITQIAYYAIIRKIKKEKTFSIKQMRYIKDITDVGQLTVAMTSVSGKEQEHYQTYLEYLKSYVDESGNLPEEPKKEKKIKPKRPLTIIEQLVL